LAPVDPARLTFGQRTDTATLEAKRAQLGLDQPLYVQLVYYLRDISPILIADANYGNNNPYGSRIKLGSKAIYIKKPYLRESYQSGRPVITIIMEALPKTLILGISALIISTILGLFLGVIAAIFKGRLLDNSIIAITTLGYSVPSYVSAIVLALIFGYWLSDYTGLGIQGSIFELNDIGDPVVRWRNLILPSIALGVRSISIFAQLTRSAMLDVLSMDYIRTAKAKGLAFKNIVKNHAFRNALNPVATSVSGWFASILAGAFFVENVFNFRGVGDLTVTALTNYDIPVLLACVILICSIFIFINILMDFIYPILDPKVKIDK
jgi:peptide/nickel transport system permease protein